MSRICLLKTPTLEIAFLKNTEQARLKLESKSELRGDK
jgi:hypothetical protein